MTIKGWSSAAVALGNYGEVLPVFSHEEEAEAFLRLGAPGAGWQVRETMAGELVSILYGLCSGVEKVALDPPGLNGEVDLVSLDRKEFARTLVGESYPGARDGQGAERRPVVNSLLCGSVNRESGKTVLDS